MIALAFAARPPATAQDSSYVVFPWSTQDMISGPACGDFPDPWMGSYQPCTQAIHDAWLADVRRWREGRLIAIGYDGSRYDDPAVAWTHAAFMQPQAMAEDRYLYDPVAGRYTVDRYLDDLTARFGGIDAVLIWPMYPNLGVDDRNQFDMVASMPGGIAGLRAMVADFHRRHVRVLFPMLLWDQGTRAPRAPWPQAVVALMRSIGADGVNGDTLDGVPLAYSRASDAARAHLVFQPEGVFHDEQLAWNLMSWGQYAFGPDLKVDRYKWLEPRHMVNISDRWNHDKTDDLQEAFFNGVGWESWENVWGIWNGITPRDAEAVRRVATIERAVAPLLTSTSWEPFYPTETPGIVASRWPRDRETVWTLVNRRDFDVDGPQLRVPAEPNVHWFDLYHGVELRPAMSGNHAVLSFAIEAHGFGAVLATTGPAPGAILATMHAMTATPLRAYASAWTPLAQSLAPLAATARAAVAPAGMVEIPATTFRFAVHGVELEGRDTDGVDVQYPWESSPRRFHDHVMHVDRFFIDRTPVTNRAYLRFIEATHYRPRDATNYLEDWTNGTYPAGWGEKPVTWVALEDARAYAAWAGKRLPHEWEWQLAAQGDDGRAYPWGAAWNAADVPLPQTGRRVRPPDDVTAHPGGASPFGVLDLVGNVWQWTDEADDDHTRAAILRGGSAYQPQGSLWYFPQAYRNDQHGKLLLMAPSRDRSAEIGFRCVMDATP